MAVQLFVLRGVPEDEAEALRQLLREHDFDYYETPAGYWGISMPALWLHDERQFEQAAALIQDYQRERYAKARSEYAELGRERRPTLFDEIRQRPLRALAYLIAVLAVLYLSTKPLLDLGA